MLFLLPLVALLVVVFLTVYLANQGALSALLLFISALFAGLLALGLHEILGSVMESWRPDYARGVMFLGVYFLTFSILRFTSDSLVGKNIVLPIWMDRVIGGFIGLFAALLIVGTTVVGIELLPVQEAIFGEHSMVEINPGSADQTGASRSGLSPMAIPQGMARAMLAAGSDHAMGGGGLAKSFSDLHPDFATELTGYRHVVQTGSHTTLPADLLDVGSAYVATADTAKHYGLPQAPAGRQLLIVRTLIKKGPGQPDGSEDVDGCLRLSTSQVRLVSTDARGNVSQNYPIGYLHQGTVFTALSLSTGHLVDTYNTKNEAVYDWVFNVDESAAPAFIEVKQSARVAVAAKLAGKPVSPLAAGEYPPVRRGGTLQIVVPADPTSPAADITVWVLRSTVARREIDKVVEAAGDTIQSKAAVWDDSMGGKGAPHRYDFTQQMDAVRNVNLMAPDGYAQWDSVLRILLTSQLTRDGPGNLTSLPEYFNSTIARMLDASPTRVKKYVTDIKGETPSEEFAPGTYLVVVARKFPKAFRVWMTEANVQREQTLKVSDAFRDHAMFEVDTTK